MIVFKRGTPQTVEDQGKVKKVKHTSLFWPIIRGIVLIVACCALIPLLSGLLYGESLRTAWALGVFLLATFALIAMTLKPETLPPFGGETTEKARQHLLPDWSLVVYCIITGMGFNWACVILWFSRRYALFSAPVLGLAGVIMLFYAATAILVARLTRGNWRIALLVFAVAPAALGAIVFRLLG